MEEVKKNKLTELTEDKIHGVRLISAENSKSPITEAYRSIRTNIQYSMTADGKERVKTLLFTSAMKNAGKSTTVANLAMVMAQAGSKVLLVDSDLRNPTMHRLFHLRKVGLTNILIGGIEPKDCIQSCGQENLYILAAGPVAPNPSELLSIPRVTELLEEAKGIYDYVLLDMPPIMPVTDAAVMGGKVDGVVLVLECGATRPEIDAEAMRRMKQAGANVVGCVMNKVDIASKDYYYKSGYGYGYGYGYDYYYYEDEDGTYIKKKK